MTPDTPGLQVVSLLVLAIAVGGALGSVARLWVSDRVRRRCGPGFPWGTLAVNLSGAFAIGVLAGWRGVPMPGATSDLLWLGLVVGLLGSYTTVSSFALQTLQLWDVGLRNAAAWNVLASVAGCLLSAIAGVAAGILLAGGG